MNKKFNKLGANEKGFTIIELIVVIAIIAILAGVVLTSMGGYQNKAKDSAILQELHGVGVGVLADNIDASGINITSTTACSSSATASAQWTAIATNEGTTISAGICVNGNCSCYGTGSNFCACAASLSDTSKFLCVDATGTTKLVSGGTSAGDGKTACNNTCSSTGLKSCACLAKGAACTVGAGTCSTCCNTTASPATTCL